MKAATVRELKLELSNRSPEELLELVLRMSKFKKENKELLTYLLYEASDEPSFIASVKRVVDEQFEQINTSSYFFIKKSIRKILREIKKYIRYSKQKQTEVELLMHFCFKLNSMSPSIDNNTVLSNIFNRQIELTRKAISTLHPDLQYDYEMELEAML